MHRRTVIVEGPLAFRMRRIAAARQGQAGVQKKTVHELAIRIDDLIPVRIPVDDHGIAESETVTFRFHRPSRRAATAIGLLAG